MRVVLRKAAHAEKSVKLTALFVSVHKPHFRNPQGQILIAVRGVFIYKHTAGAVHRLNRTVLAVDFGGIHVVLIVVPVTGIFPKASCKDNGRLNFYVALSAVQIAPEIYKRIFKHHAVRQKEGKAFALVQKREKL